MKLLFPSQQKLLPFQETAIEETLHFLANGKENACYNACEMGLGKTIQALVAMNTLDCGKILIICPAIMRLVWVAEISKWTIRKDVCLVESGKDITKMFSSAWSCLVTSYGMATNERLLSYLEKQKWDALIMDESHYLKNGRTKRTKAVLQRLWPQAKYRLALSGTPFTTRVVDGYTLFHRMLPSRWADFNSFANEFSYSQIKYISGRRITDYFGVKNPEVLRKIIRSNFYVRYTKEEVLKDLPPKQFTCVPLPIKYAVDPKSKNERDQLLIEAETIRRAIEEGNNPPPLPQTLAEHRRLQGERKVEAVVEFVEDLLEQNIPVVIFAWHRRVIDALGTAFKEYKPAIISGSTTPESRERSISNFQRGSTPLFIGNYIAAGTGITLTVSSTVVLAELDWSPTTLTQAIDRLHRIGQKDVVNVYYFVVEHSIDEIISNTVMNRAKIFKQVLE